MKIIKPATNYYECEECGAQFLPESEKDFKKEYRTEDKGIFILPIFGSFEYKYLECPCCMTKKYISRKPV